MLFYFFIFDFIILVVMLLFCLIQKNQNKINKSNIEVDKLLYKHAKLQEEKFLQKIKNLEDEKIEMEKKFALEIEEVRRKFEKITTSQHRRINMLEGKKSSKIFEEKSENIF